MTRYEVNELDELIFDLDAKFPIISKNNQE